MFKIVIKEVEDFKKLTIGNLTQITGFDIEYEWNGKVRTQYFEVANFKGSSEEFYFRLLGKSEVDSLIVPFTFTFCYSEGKEESIKLSGKRKFISATTNTLVKQND